MEAEKEANEWKEKGTKGIIFLLSTKKEKQFFQIDK